MRHFLILCIVALAGGCSSVPSYRGCASHQLNWTFGPTGNTPYLDVCYVELPYRELDKYYNFVPIAGSNPDTRQPIDSNSDGISDNGQRLNNGMIRWGGMGCQQYARRVTQRNCESLGNNTRTGGCDWISVHLQAKPGYKNVTLDLAPIWRVRLPDGREQNIRVGAKRTGFDQCP